MLLGARPEKEYGGLGLGSGRAGLGGSPGEPWTEVVGGRGCAKDARLGLGGSGRLWKVLKETQVTGSTGPFPEAQADGRRCICSPGLS